MRAAELAALTRGAGRINEGAPGPERTSSGAPNEPPHRSGRAGHSFEGAGPPTGASDHFSTPRSSPALTEAAPGRTVADLAAPFEPSAPAQRRAAAVRPDPPSILSGPGDPGERRRRTSLPGRSSITAVEVRAGRWRPPCSCDSRLARRSHHQGRARATDHGAGRAAALRARRQRPLGSDADSSDEDCVVPVDTAALREEARRASGARRADDGETAAAKLTPSHWRDANGPIE